MPIEIRELLIRVTVNQPQAGGDKANPVTSRPTGEDEKEALVAQCVEEALRIIHNEQER